LVSFLILVVAITCAAAYQFHRWMTTSAVDLVLAVGVVSSEVLVANLDSSDADLVMTSLSILEDRLDPSGRDKAVALMGSEDNVST